MNKLKVAVRAAEPIMSAGIEEFLCVDPCLVVVPESGLADADVVMIACAVLDDRAAAAADVVSAVGSAPVLFVVGEVSEPAVAELGGTRTRRILDFATLTAESLVAAVHEARRDGAVDLADQVRLLGIGSSAAPDDSWRGDLTQREIAVLRLMADGLGTTEVARELRLSARTAAGVVHDLIAKWNVRNRAHAVAHAIRTGVI